MRTTAQPAKIQKKRSKKRYSKLNLTISWFLSIAGFACFASSYYIEPFNNYIIKATAPMAAFTPWLQQWRSFQSYFPIFASYFTISTTWTYNYVLFDEVKVEYKDDPNEFSTNFAKVRYSQIMFIFCLFNIIPYLF